MKRIIDIDENLVREGFVRNFTEEEKDVLIKAVRYSTPYNPANALTEAEKIICKMYLEDLDKFHTCNEYKILMNLIDNAQTDNEPKGAWAFDEKGYFYCNQCSKYPHDQYATTEFCPKCGAKLTGGTCNG